FDNTGLFFFQAEDGIRDFHVTGVQTCALPISIEESEHKAVAFDVYKSVGGSEFIRVTEMMVVSVVFPLFTTIHVVQLMKADGQLGNLKSWLGALNYMWGIPGVVRKLIPSYLKYYSPKFHPWDNDARHLLDKAKKRWLPESIRG